MKKLINRMVIVCFVFFSSSQVFGQDSPLGEDDMFLGEVVLLEGSDCMALENSCSIEFLQSVLCAFRSYLCVDDGNTSVFSWGLLATIHALELGEFRGIDPALVETYGSTAEEQVDFINHETLEHMICTLEGDELCRNDSFYNFELPPKNCVVNPRACGINSGG